MPPVIYVPRKLPGIIRCPVDANPPVTSVKWEKDGYPLRVEKVGRLWRCASHLQRNKRGCRGFKRTKRVRYPIAKAALASAKLI